MKMRFENLLKTSSFILTEGAVVERLKSEFGLMLDPHINNAGLIYGRQKKLETIYRQYIDIAEKYNHPIMLTTPTRKVNAETHKKSVYRKRDVIADSCGFLRDIKLTYNRFSDQIYLGGLLGCRGNAYRADNALSENIAYRFHKLQVDRFREQDLDYLLAAIMPVLSEAVGMARALSGSGLPYIISFMVRKDGRLLDGTFISDAIDRIDNAADPHPAGYMASCIHPSNLKQALNHPINKKSPAMSRFIGTQANASSLSPEELDQSNELHQDDPQELIREMCSLKSEFGLKILGGCCGTDDHLIDRLAQLDCI